MVTNLMVKAYVWATSLRSNIEFAHHGERGQDLIEYALLGGLIAGGIVALGVGIYTGIVANMVDGVGNCVDFNKATTCSAGF